VTKPVRRLRKRGVGRRILRRRERLMALLEQNCWYTTRELATIMHVSRWTIDRDLRAIEVPDDPCARRMWLRRRVIIRHEVTGAREEL